MIRAKKSLGQNFLTDQKIIDKIINIVDIKDRSILEIGKVSRLIANSKFDDLAKCLQSCINPSETSIIDVT